MKIKFKTYLTDKKKNYVNPVTNETWEQERARRMTVAKNQVSAGATSSMYGLLTMVITIGLFVLLVMAM